MKKHAISPIAAEAVFRSDQVPVGELAMLKKILVTFCLLTLSLLARAQSDLNVIPFQGQLASQAGQALNPSNAVTLVFRLYTAPAGGMAMWEESQPKISVNTGRFSVLLGSRTMLPDPKNFNATLYLGITVDDGNPATVDVELRPRQAIVPVISARYAQNADKLNGYDWSALFGTNNPTGSISGARIANGSITFNQIAPVTITAGQIAPQTITASQIANGVITAQQLAGSIITSNQIVVGSISSPNLADGAVTQSKLALRPSGPTVPAGGFAVSGIVSNYSTGSSTLIPVTNMTVTITTTGRPVYIGFRSLPVGNAINTPVGGQLSLSNGSAFYCQLRDQTSELAYYSFYCSGVSRIDIPPSVISHVYLPPAGTYTYTLYIATDPGRTIAVSGQMIAFEL